MRKRIWASSGQAVGGGTPPILPDETDVYAPMGTDTQSLSAINGELGAQPLGTDTQSHVSDDLDASGAFPLGTDTQSLSVADITGAGTDALGTDTQSLVVVLAGALDDVPLGTETASLEADSTAVGTGYTGTATQTRNGGAHDWLNPTNAQGAFDNARAAISAAADATSGDTLNADLKCTNFGVPTTTPSGWTRSAVALLYEHDYDANVGVLSTVSFVVNLRESDGTLISTIQTITVGDSLTEIDEEFDITSAVSGLTDAELAGVQVWFEADANLLILTGGNCAWSVDGCHLRITYTRTGIT